MKGILGRKVEMTQVFTEAGKLIPVTVLEVLPNKILQVKTIEHDGYIATQLGVKDKRVNLVNKPELGHFNKASSAPKRYVKEIRNMEGYTQGQVINAQDIFVSGQYVDVTGISKGKGFAGAIKRHNYSRGPMAHGSGYYRGIGSMGAIINRIFKSKKMAGHMGHAKVTIQNLEIVAIDTNANIMLVKGSVPGPKNGFVQIKENAKQVKATEAVELLTRTINVVESVVEETPIVEEVKAEEVVVEQVSPEPVAE